MQDLIDAETEKNSIRMELSYLKARNENQISPYLIVEGQTDLHFFRKFTSEKCSIRFVNGKDNVIDVITKLENECVILGIIDADYWHLDNIKPKSRNIVLTDYHDIEVMMIQSNSYGSFLSEHADLNKIKEIEKKEKTDFLAYIFEECSKIGYFRFFSKKESNFNDLNFNKLEYDKFFDSNKIYIDETKLIDSVLRRSLKWNLLKPQLEITMNKTIDVKYIKNLISKYKNPAVNLNQLCRGHDLTKIIYLCFFENVGSTHFYKNVNNENTVESFLRSSYQINDFVRTNLYLNIKNWETEKGFEILNPNVS